MNQLRRITSVNGPAGRKVEPKPHVISPAGVSQIGSSMGNHASDASGKILHGASKPMYTGDRGYSAPMNSSQSHRSGSQGRH